MIPDLRRRRPIGPLLLALLLPTIGPLAGLGCSRGEAGQAKPTTSVSSGTLQHLVIAVGTLEPEKIVDVRPRTSGIIEKVAVEDGDFVEAGQLLIEIDREILEVRLREAKASLESALVEERYARLALERRSNLSSEGTLSISALDDAKSRFEIAKATVARTRAAAASLEVELKHATVVSPMTGRVLEVHVEEGSAVSSVLSVTGGTPLLTIASTGPLHLEALVDENEIARVSPGQEARIRTEAFGDDKIFAGRVREISPLGKRIQNVTYFEVEVEVEDADHDLLLPRMSGNADIVTATAKDVRWLPETALFYDGDRIFVERLIREDPLELEEVDVEIGTVEDDRVQIVRGPKLGEIVQLR